MTYPFSEPVSVVLPRNEWGWTVDALRERARAARSAASKATTTAETAQRRLATAENLERVAARIEEATL